LDPEGEAPTKRARASTGSGFLFASPAWTSLSASTLALDSLMPRDSASSRTRRCLSPPSVIARRALARAGVSPELSAGDPSKIRARSTQRASTKRSSTGSSTTICLDSLSIYYLSRCLSGSRFTGSRSQAGLHTDGSRSTRSIADVRFAAGSPAFAGLPGQASNRQGHASVRIRPGAGQSPPPSTSPWPRRPCRSPGRPSRRPCRDSTGPGSPRRPLRSRIPGGHRR